MTQDEAIARARSVACAGCDDTEHEMLRGLLAAYDEAQANVAAWQSEELERRRERDEALAQLAALRETVSEVLEKGATDAEDAGIHSCHDRCSRPACVMRRERDEAARQLIEARRQLAALRAAASAVTLGAVTLAEIVHAEEWDALDAAISDTAATAEAYDRRVRAEALREAAACTVDGLRLWGRKAQGDASEWLRARADEIGRGAR